MIDGVGILHAKRHYVVAIHPYRSNKCHVHQVGQIPWDLIVAEVSVKKGEKFMSNRRVHNLINLWERKCIFRASIIQVRIVDTSTPLAIFLGNNHDVG